MLQNTNTRYQDTPPPDSRFPIISLVDVLDFARRRLSIILLTCLVTPVIALVYLITAVPTFTAKADLVVVSKASPPEAASLSTIVESQIEIIKSESIARVVIEKLDLANDPEFVGHGGRSMIRSISRLLGLSKPELEVSAAQQAVEAFERKLSAKRVGLTYIVNLTFDSTDPRRAAQILNTVAETFIVAQMDAKYKSDLRNEKWVKDRTNELSTQASASQKALANYRKNRNDEADAVVAAPPQSQLAAKKQGELRELEVAAESAARTYDNFLRMLRYMEAQQLSSPVLEAHLLGEASRPLRASSPKARIVLGMSVVGGLLLGVAIGLLRDLFDRGIAINGRFWRERQTVCIAVVPRVKPCGCWRQLINIFSGVAGKLSMRPASLVSVASMQNRALSTARPSTDGSRALKCALSKNTSTEGPRQNIVRGKSPVWTITNAPQSRFTDSILEIKLAIDMMNRSGKRNQVIGITSTQPNEGKSTVAAALALLLAHTGARAILVDCNLRNQALSAELAPAAAFGLLDVMREAVSVSEATWTDSISQLAFLPVGNNSRPIYATDLLTSDMLDKLFQTLREAYEYVIVDLPAVAPFGDVRAAAHLLDSFILVVECGRTDIGVVERALKVCSDMDEIMLGITLNKADADLFAKEHELRS